MNNNKKTLTLIGILLFVALAVVIVFYEQLVSTPAGQNPFLSRVRQNITQSLKTRSDRDILRSIEEDLTEVDREYNFKQELQTKDLEPNFNAEDGI